MAAPSPLVLGIHLCQSSNCKILRLSETTGVYNAATNPGGWGSPNPTTLTVLGLTIDITDPTGTTYNFDQTALVGYTWPDPTGVSETPFIYSGGINVGAVAADPFVDGFYTVTYTVDGVWNAPPAGLPVAYTNTVTQAFLLTCQIRCCIDKMFHLASQSDCKDCKNEKLDNALEADAYLKSAEFAAACGKIEMAKKHLAKAQWICNTKNCLNC